MQYFPNVFWAFPGAFDQKVPIEKRHHEFLHEKHTVAFFRLIDRESFQRSTGRKFRHDARMVAGD